MKGSNGLLPRAGILADKAASLRLRARSLSDSIKQGGARSLYKGRGIDFSGVREYLHGDDVRTIDWNVTARMGKPFVKIFEEERELIVFLIVDMSASMDSGSGTSSRLRHAAQTAASVIFASVHSAGSVGCVLFDGEILFSAEPKSGKDYAMLLVSKLNIPPPRNTAGTALNQALRGSAALLKNRSLVFVISDFRCSGYEEQLASLALKHEVIAVCITDPLDTALPECGGIPFADTENGLRTVLPTSAQSFQREWRDFHKRHAERRYSLCVRRGVFPLDISTAEDPLHKLIEFFASRESGL